MTLSRQPLTARVITRLGRVRPGLLIVGAIAYLLIALAAPGVLGAVLLLALVVALVGLARYSWHRQPAGARLVRCVILAGLLLVAITKLL